MQNAKCKCKMQMQNANANFKQKLTKAKDRFSGDLSNSFMVFEVCIVKRVLSNTYILNFEPTPKR